METTLQWIAQLGGISTPANSAGPEPTGAWTQDGARATESAEPAIGSGGDAAVRQLRSVVGVLVARGTDDEAPLLRQARELRDRIEHPGQSQAADETGEPIGLSVTDAVRRSLVQSPPGSAERIELISWVAPVFRNVAEFEITDLAALPPVTERVRTADGNIDVTAGGVDRNQVEHALVRIAARYPDSTIPFAVES